MLSNVWEMETMAQNGLSSFWLILCHWFLSGDSRPEVIFKKGFLRNFAKFAWKHLCQSLFLLKLQASACNFIKKEALAQVFSCESAKFLGTNFLKEHLWWLLLSFQVKWLSYKSTSTVTTQLSSQKQPQQKKLENRVSLKHNYHLKLNEPNDGGRGFQTNSFCKHE